MPNLVKAYFNSQVRSLRATISTDYISCMVVNSKNKSGLRCSTTERVKYCLLFYYIGMASYMMRMLIAALVLNKVLNFISPKVYLEVEPLIGYGIREGIIDRYSVVVIWPVFLILFAVDFVVHFQRKSGVRQCCRLAFDLMVLNRENFYLLNPQLNWQNILLKFLFNNEGNVVKVTRKPLPHFPRLKRCIRRKAVIFSLAFDLFATFSYIHITFFGISIACYFYFFTVWPVYSFARGLFNLFDIVFLGWTIFHSVDLGFFFIHFANLLLYVLSMQQKASIWRLELLLKKVSKSAEGKCLESNKRKLAAFLRSTYLPVYSQIVRHLDTSNKELVSKGLMLTLLSLFGYNVYSVSMLTLKKFKLEVLSVLFSINFTATFFFFLLIRPLVEVERTMRSARNCLRRAQPYLKTGSAAVVGLQLKMISTSSSVFAFTVGPVGVLTTKSLYEVGKQSCTKLKFKFFYFTIVYFYLRCILVILF